MSEKMEIPYRTFHKAIPPQPIRVKVPGWAGSPQIRMQNGSEPQPWHCPPFVDASGYGLELLYPYETECHVVNENGEVRIEWDPSKEPGGVAGPGEFGLFAPKPTKFYSFGTSVDLQAPPGYALRTGPHPRFFTDETGTVPIAVIGHVNSDWWSKKLFCVFRAPPPGHRHIFRKNEPYVQILFVPQKMAYEPVRMSAEVEARRSEIDEGINLAKPYIAKRVWHNPAGSEFSDHYKVLARAHASGGEEAVAVSVRDAVRYRKETLPLGKTIPEYFELARQYQTAGKLVEAKSVYFHIRQLDPNNAEAASRLGLLAASMGLYTVAMQLLSKAAALQPQSPGHLHNLGEMLRRRGRFQEAVRSFRAALQLAPKDPQLMSNLGLTLAQEGRGEEAIETCRAAVAAGAGLPIVRYRLGRVLAMQQRHAEAREAYNAALAIDPHLAPALDGLKELESAPVPAPPV
jgi:tetratricopeptide (TPR) repeat protein